MTEQRLNTGEPRIGVVSTMIPNTPADGWALMLDENDIRVGHTSTGLVSSEVERWVWGRTVHWGDDPDHANHSYEPPEILWFTDGAGTATLMDCVGSKSTGNMPWGTTAWLRYRKAVLGGRQPVDYRRIHGMRHALPGLREWMRVPGSEPAPNRDSDGRVRSVDLHVESPPAIPLCHRLNFCVQPSFRFRRDHAVDTTTLTETLLLQTEVCGRPRPWSEHKALHYALRDLLRVAAWRPFRLNQQQVLHTQDPVRVISGRPIGKRWAEVIEPAARHQETHGQVAFLFRWDEVGGAAGFRRWLRLREQFQRGIDPLLGTVSRGDTALEIAMAQAAIGLDGLGYQMALDAGANAEAADGESHESRLLRVWDSLVVTPAGDRNRWASVGANAYNAVKHAKRKSVPAQLALDTLRTHQLVFRLWVASRLGAAAEAVAQHLEHDPLNAPSEVRSIDF